MSDRTCSVAGCEKKHLAKGLCMTHYHRVRDNGTTDLIHRPRPKRDPLPCSVDECDKSADSLGLCQKHYTRLRRNGDALALRGYTQGKADQHPNWRGDAITYIGAHFRVMRHRGKASEHDCIDCGSPANEWSYDHQDPDEKIGDRGEPYSPDPDHYDPRCHSCHTRFDHGRLREGRHAFSATASV